MAIGHSSIPLHRDGFGRRPEVNKIKILTISIVLLMLIFVTNPSVHVSAGPLAAASNPGLGTAANS